jgi:peptide/nickel transport system substrate-binding protein
MTQAQKVEAAKQAATAMLLKAGYGQDPISGKFVLAPEGAALKWQVIVPGNGMGDQPCYKIFTGAKETLQEMGLDLIITDPIDSNVLWNALDAGTVQIWTAAWGVTPDPDMHQVYHSSNIVGKPGSSCSNHYRIADPEQDRLIMAARSTTDKAARKDMYRQCLEIILDWGVEIPVYQRQECTVFSCQRIDTATIAADCTPYYGWMAEIHKLKLRSEP